MAPKKRDDRPATDERRVGGDPGRTEPKQKTGDATPRVARKPSPAQHTEGPGLAARGKRRRTTDTRGSRTSLSKQAVKEQIEAGRPEHTTASDVAEVQKVRKSPKKAQRTKATEAKPQGRRSKKTPDVPAPVEAIKVQGAKVELVANPVKFDPTELKPARREGVTKDYLRSLGRIKEADAPERRVESNRLPPLEELV